MSMGFGPSIPAVCLAIALCLGTATAAEYYVDVDSRGGPADDAGPGSLEKPWRTLARATGEGQPCPGPGDTVWIRGGVYKETVRLTAGGAAGRPLTIKAFGDEKPVIDGDGQRTNGVVFAEEGGADHVVVEGLTLRNFRSGAVGFSATRRTGITVRNVDVSGARIGVWLSRCADFRLLGSDIHHCEDGNVLVDTGCTDIAIADNHIHHNPKRHSLSVYAPGNGVRGQGRIVSVVPHGPGLARVTTEDLDFSKVRGGTLRGQDETGSVEAPGLVLLFAGGKPEPDGQHLPGGTLRLQDGRDWFVLRNDPDWAGKPYSPDGKTALVELGKTPVQALAGADYVYVAYTFPPRVANRDIRILRNEVDHSAVQGIWLQRAEGVLVQGNRTHHNGATGIQVESLCRRIWIDGNVSYANCQAYGHETGIWLDETIDAVVQNNTVYENQKGMGVTQCDWVIVRRNMIRDNQAQHVTKDVRGCRGNAGAFWFSGGRHYHLGAPPGARHNAFVHNTCFRNGWPTSSWGGIQHGIPGYPPVTGNLFVNNLVQHNQGKHPVYVGRTPAVLDGNLYFGPAPFKALWVDAEEKATYVLSDAQGWSDYQRATGQDAHSRFTESEVAAADNGDLHPAPGSPAIDGGRPLTRATRAGSGTEVPVADTSCFTAGLKTRTGETVVPGDEIMVAGALVRIVDIDRAASVLTVDRAIEWKQDAPVAYPYHGAAPDVGAVEVR